MKAAAGYIFYISKQIFFCNTGLIKMFVYLRVLYSTSPGIGPIISCWMEDHLEEISFFLNVCI